MTPSQRRQFGALVAGWPPERRALYERLAAGMAPEDRWLLEQEILLLRRYRWTPRIAANPVRRLVHAVLFPFFHWRLYVEWHNRRAGRWAWNLLGPYLDGASSASLRARESVRKARAEMGNLEGVL